MSHTERDLDRAAHPAPCKTNPDGTRQYTPDPAPRDIIRNFGHTPKINLPTATKPAKA